MNDVELVRVILAYGQMLAARMGVDERGEVTEKVLVTAIFAALALGAGAIIAGKVMTKASSIATD